jgi:hypothetical protein
MKPIPYVGGKASMSHINFHENSLAGSRDTGEHVHCCSCKVPSFIDPFLCCVFCVLYCSLFLYCTVSACDVRAAILTEVFPCFFLCCKANARV